MDFLCLSIVLKKLILEHWKATPPMLLHWEKDWLLFEHGKDNRHRKKKIYSMRNYIRKNNISMLMKTTLLGLFLLYALVLFPLYSSIFFSL